MFKKFKQVSAINRVLEEKLYAFAYEEIQSNDVKSGLYAQALVASKGEEKVARAAYIKLRVQSLKDEFTIDQLNDEIYLEAFKNVDLAEVNQNTDNQFSIGPPSTGSLELWSEFVKEVHLANEEFSKVYYATSEFKFGDRWVPFQATIKRINQAVKGEKRGLWEDLIIEWEALGFVFSGGVSNTIKHPIKGKRDIYSLKDFVYFSRSTLETIIKSNGSGIEKGSRYRF
jgi:hypothetical protein